MECCCVCKTVQQPLAGNKSDRGLHCQEHKEKLQRHDRALQEELQNATVSVPCTNLLCLCLTKIPTAIHCLANITSSSTSSDPATVNWHFFWCIYL